MSVVIVLVSFVVLVRVSAKGLTELRAQLLAQDVAGAEPPSGGDL